MASPSTVLTRGYGSWGTVNEVITLGYGISNVVIIAGPYRVQAVATHQPGSSAINAHQPGAVKQATHQPGVQAVNMV